MSALTIAAAVVVGGGGIIGVLWLAARPSRNGTLAQAWGQLDDDEATQEIESVFAGATKPVETPGDTA
jgi:hypothetical protein